MCRFLLYINKPSLVPIGRQLFKWGESDDLWPWYITFDCINIKTIPYSVHKPSLVLIGFQRIKWGHFHSFFILSYNLNSYDLWPWYVIFDITNKWGFPCCIYDPTLVEILQSMCRLHNPFSRQHRQQQWRNRSLCVFPAIGWRHRRHKNHAMICVICLNYMHRLDKYSTCLVNFSQ